MIDLLEEAIHLLRRASAIMYAYYILGVTPFALLFFQLLADASYHRYLAEHLGDSVIRLALAYCWMKGFQALACQRLLASYSGEPVPHRGPLEMLRLWSAQCAIQPWGILIKPMAFIALVPSPFVDAFFQTASIVMTGNRGDFMRCVQLSTGKIGPGLILNGIIFTFRIVMFACVYSTLAALPFLCKMLLGVETLLTHNFQWLVSVPFLIGAGFVSYFVIDLLQKSFYVIRLRRIECETSGKIWYTVSLGWVMRSGLNKNEFEESKELHEFKHDQTSTLFQIVGRNSIGLLKGLSFIRQRQAKSVEPPELLELLHLAIFCGYSDSVLCRANP